MGIYVNNTFAPAIKINQPINPTGTLSISRNGLDGVAQYSSISVNIVDNLDKYATVSKYLYYYEDLSATKINPYAFTSCFLSGINMPNVETICSSAFNNVYVTPPNSIITFAFPKCTYVGTSAFTKTGAFGSEMMRVELSSPSYTTVLTSAFYNNRYLVSVSIPNCITIESSAFQKCTILSSIYMPKCEYIGNSAFRYCSSLASINISNCISIGTGIFRYCQNLSSIILF